MRKFKDRYPITVMASLLQVSRSGYYDWYDRPASTRTIDNEKLDTYIKAIAAKGRYTYGAVKISRELRKENKFHGEKRIRNRMKELGIKVKRVRKQRRTTIANPEHEITENILNRDFAIQESNKAWAGDITYIQTTTGWCYLAIVLDLHSRKVIGWDIAKSMETGLVVSAFEKALRLRQPSEGLLFHSDRGSQYTSKEYKVLLERHGVTHSMSRKGNCWDNAVVESFNGVLKLEWLYALDAMPKDLEEVKLAVFDYIEVFYNRIRIHSTLGYNSPDEFEQKEMKLVA